MKTIKLYEKFNEDILLKNNINDILVELKDDGFEYYISQTGYEVEVEISKERSDIDDDDFDFDSPLYYDDNATNLFFFTDVYEPIMTLLSYMRDKYPDMKVDYYICTYNHEQTDDYIDEFLEKNDLEKSSIEDVEEFSDISLIRIEFNLK